MEGGQSLSFWTDPFLEYRTAASASGAGESFLALGLGYAEVRAGHTTRFIHADGFFRSMSQARVILTDPLSKFL